VDEHGVAVLRKQLKRDQVAPFFARMEPCLVGIEACGGAHYWAAKLSALGHRVKMMAPQFVKPYVKTNKNDSLDAEAICEAVARPNMRFVPVKLPEQQAVLSLHTARESFVRARTAQANQIRGLLLEFGLIVPAQRHVANSITTLRLQLAVTLAIALEHCPHCSSVNLRLRLRQ
jgi:transposase